MRIHLRQTVVCPILGPALRSMRLLRSIVLAALGLVLVAPPSSAAGVAPVDADVLALEVVDETPRAFRLSAARPNPFSSTTRLELTLDQTSALTVAVFDALGREVVRLHEGTLAAGTYALVAARWARGEAGAARTASGIARAFCRAMGLRLSVHGVEALRAHTGFVFFNHVSHLDIPVVMALRPVRFLATAGVRSLPAIGWMARAVGTLFVRRGDPSSRTEARADLAEAYRQSPLPVAVAPEGGVRPGPLPDAFRHGAFEVVRDLGARVLLVAVTYEPRGTAAWLEGESLVRAAWRLASHRGGATAHVDVLAPARPVDDPEAEADAAQARVAEALRNRF